MNLQPLIGLGVWWALSRPAESVGDDMPVIDPPGGYSDAIRRFAQAIAVAEGFGTPGAVPTRLNNPGDLKASSVPSIGADTQGHLHFATLEDGWRALYRQLRLITLGQSRYYCLAMTLTEMSTRYAGHSATWAANVARVLGVPTSTTLREILS